MIYLTVSGGSASATIDFGNLACEGLSMISPDNTPLYDIDIFDSDGVFVVGAKRVEVQYAKINENFRLVGPCQIVIQNAADDGLYRIKPLPK